MIGCGRVEGGGGADLHLSSFLWVLYDDYTEQLCVLLPGTHYTLVPLPLAFQGGSEGGF